MIGYLVRRLLLALFTSWAISVLAFAIIQLPPGDFVDAYISNLSPRAAASPSIRRSNFAPSTRSTARSTSSTGAGCA
jgi:ABC-type microcin C transport system permease subunit YejB